MINVLEQSGPVQEIGHEQVPFELQVPISEQQLGHGRVAREIRDN
jgi:hypothetical protein